MINVPFVMRMFEKKIEHLFYDCLVTENF